MLKAIFCLFLMAQLTTLGAASLPTPVNIDFDIRTLNKSESINLKNEYSGKLILVVNTASKCAYTDQYQGLEEIYSEYKEKGLVVLGFPSNEFYQELDSEEQIQEFCRLTYGVEFPMFEKTLVKQKHAHPLFRALGQAAGEFPAWNFHKYLIDKKGNLVGSYTSSVVPERGQLLKDIIDHL